MSRTGSIHFADINKSPRLQRVLLALFEAGDDGLTTRDIIERANVCAVSSAVCELNRNGYLVKCTPEGRSKGSNIFRYHFFPEEKNDMKKFLPISQTQITENPLTIKGGAITLTNDQYGKIN
jgi:hypothetical protein